MVELLKHISFSSVLYVISGLLLLLCLVQKNSNFLDVRTIFIQQFRVFKNSPLQFIGIFVVPLFLSIATVRIRVIDKDIVNNINIVLSILIAMFFSMLSVLSAFNRKQENREYNQLLKETFNAVMFECILGIVLLVISFIELFINSFINNGFQEIISAVIYYLVMVVVLNIFVIIKRMKVLFDYKDK